MTDSLSSRIKPAFDAVFPWLISGIALIVAIMLITPRTAVMKISDEAWLDSSTEGVSGQLHQPVEPPAQVSTSENFEGNPAQSSEPAQPSVDSVADLTPDPPGDSTVSVAISSSAMELEADAPRQPVTSSDDSFPAESLPPPAAGPDKAGASNIEDTEATGKSVNTAGASTIQDTVASSKSVDTAGAEITAIKEPDTPVTGSESRETLRDGGPWVINLTSSRSKDNAERFKARAVTRGVAAELYRVTVKGDEYWRVQVPGFATAAEAKAEAGLIKEKLGLDDVWIVKR